MNDELLLEIKDLCVSIQQKRLVTPIVRGIDLTIKRGSIVGLVGESGCGKSMTAKAVNSILPPLATVTGGSVLWHEPSGSITDLVKLKEKEIRKICGTKIGMVFQEPMTSLNPMMRVGDQISEVLKIHNLERNSRKAKERVIQMLEAVGITQPELRYSSWPHELSGGQRQRVMIAMAMICSPKLLIAD